MTASVGGSWRRPDIQGLRALAVLSVIAFHADLPIPGGFTGVDIFFVISGYVITLLLLREHSKGTLSFATFYARRAQRLLPALAVMVAVTFVLSWLIQSPFGAQQTTATTGIGAMLLVANVVIVRSVGDYFAAAAEANPLLNTWSLSVEEQFYLVYPLIAVIALTKLRHRLSLFWVVAVLTMTSFALSVAWTGGWSPADLTSQPEAWAFYLSPSRAWEFGAGALLAIAIARHDWRPSARMAHVFGFLGLILVAISWWGISAASPFPGALALFPVLGTAALIAAGVQANPVSRILSTPPAVRVGDWSYSLYLWHWPIIVFALILWPEPWTPVIAAALSFVPSLISYHYLEEPIRHRRMSRGRIAVLGVSTSAVVVLLGVLLSSFGPRTMPGVANLNEQRVVPGISDSAGCFLLGEFTDQLMDTCWFRTPDATGWVLLAGDSHAAHLSDAVVTAAHERNLDVFSVTGGVCPFLVVPAGASDVPNCDEMNRSVWSLIDSDNPPEVVVIGDKGIPQGAEETLRAIEMQAIPVVFVRDVPRWAPLDRRIQNLPCTGGALTFDCSFTYEETERFSQDNRSAEVELLNEFPDTVSIDPWPLFCEGETCSPVQDGVLQYIDNEHLNGLGSRRLAPLMSQALDAAIN